MNCPPALIGIDLGQAQDFTALAIIMANWAERRRTYTIPHLQRFPLGTPYPTIVQGVEDLLRTNELRGSLLVVDQTGVGRAVVDLMLQQMRTNRVPGGLTAITITGGHTAQPVEGGHHVPKKELVSTLQVLLQSRRLKVAQSLPDAAVLVRELEQFKVKITASANETFGVWREGQHDDLVLAVAMATWFAENRIGSR